MGVILLLIKCTLENATNLRAPENTKWFMKVKCNNCNEISDKFVYVTTEEEQDNPGGRGKLNLLIKCKFCKRDNSIDVLPKKAQAYNAEDSDKYKQFAGFECRGVTPVEWQPKGKYSCEGSESGTKFKVDTSEGDWVDYDEKASVPVGIYDIVGKFEKE